MLAAVMGIEGDLVAERLARGCRCFVVWIEGSIAGYGWLSTEPEWIGEIQREIKPRTGEGYVWNCVTLAEHRRRGIFRSLLVGISDIGRRGGLRRLWIGTVAIPAERALGPSGFEPVLHFASVTFGGLHAMRVKRSPDSALAQEAQAVLGVRPGWTIRRLHSRRH